MGLLWLLVKIGVFKGWALWMKLSPVLIYLLYFLVIAIPMNFTAPSGSLMVLRKSVQINPAVSGQVSEVLVESGVVVDVGTPLFSIDPTPFEARLESLEAKLALAETRLAQSRELIVKQAGREFDVQTFEAEVAQLLSEIEGARWNLEHTTVVAPARGFVPTITLEPGTQVGPPPSRPVMAFIDSAQVAVTARIGQNYLRHIEPGQKADLVFRLFPGDVHTAKVDRVVQANPLGQVDPSGRAIDTSTWAEQPFLVSFELDSDIELRDLPAGAYGTAVIYTADMSSLGELIRAVMLRVETWMNYL